MRLQLVPSVLFGLCLLAALALPSCSNSDDVLNSGLADPPCSDQDGNRFVDCGNGTVTDTNSGLIWLKSANCFDKQNWDSAMASAAGLSDGQCGLTDGSGPGDWRLPTLDCPTGDNCMFAQATGEFSTIFGTECAYAPYFLNAAGTGCGSEGDPFTGVQSASYWSTYYRPGEAWRAAIFARAAATFPMSGELWMWPVRGGQ